MSSNMQIYEMLAQGVRLWASRGISITEISPIGFQGFWSLRPILADHYFPGITASRLSSALANPPAKVHNCLWLEWHILTEISSHSWRGPLPHLWLPFSHIVLATWSNNTCRFPNPYWKVITQGIHQGVLSCPPWVWSLLESFLLIFMDCVSHIACCWHSKGYTHNIRNHLASLLVVTRDLGCVARLINHLI